MTSSTRSRVIQSKDHFDRIRHMLDHMADNRAYKTTVSRHPAKDPNEVLAEFKQRFQQYRHNWSSLPQSACNDKIYGQALKEQKIGPLCIDLEMAAICNLVCPFCYRQHIATPDKLMHESLWKKAIDQAGQLGVPSMKFNWRGEPLMHPRLAEAIARAKGNGIIDTMINTNALLLDEKTSRKLIEAGLDLMIYSFDGGTAQSYERMRVGRFAENSFEAVCRNIKRFNDIRREMGSVFPRTKIQMLLTKETFHEQEFFFKLFQDCVDDVSVKAYTERGGSLHDLDPQSQEKLKNFLNRKKLAHSTAYWRDMHDNISVALGRLPCEQPYQRLMIAYDGRVAMCCYDWGCEHPVGYLDKRAFERGNRDYEAVQHASRAGAKGFEKIVNLRMPKPYSAPPLKVESIEQIWHGGIINCVREKHVSGRSEDIEICRKCPFKETFLWERI
ncbi:MAG: radical SAM protein [Desulfurivibrio sp.]|nr:MAG: radical SAM protein [Desulfurivibrio sp.]